MLVNKYKEGKGLAIETTYVVKKDVLIVRIAGELDHYTAEKIRKEWQEKMYINHIKHVIVNLKDVPFMDSSGIGVILGRYKEVLQLGGEMVICHTSPDIKRLLDMSGLFKIVRLEESEQFALSTLGVAS